MQCILVYVYIMKKRHIVNISGFGWSGSTLLVELLQLLGFSAYHDEFNYFRHPLFKRAIVEGRKSDLIRLHIIMSKGCLYQLRSSKNYSRGKLILEVLSLILLVALIPFKKVDEISKLFLKIIYLLYSKEGVLLLDQFLFPEDLELLEHKINLSEEYEISHVYVRRNLEKILKDRKRHCAYLNAYTLREKFLIGDGYSVSDEILYGRIAGDLFKERIKVVEQCKFENLLLIEFEKLVTMPIPELSTILEFLRFENLSDEQVYLVEKFVEPSRNNV